MLNCPARLSGTGVTRQPGVMVGGTAAVYRESS